MGLLVLLGGWFVVTQAFQRSGAEITWLSDLDQALRVAREKKQLVFLVLHQPNDPLAEANQRNLFTQRQVRERLAQMTCCRIEVQPVDKLRPRFGFRGPPLMLVLAPPEARPLMRPLEGKIDLLEFMTVVNGALKAHGAPEP